MSWSRAIRCSARGRSGSSTLKSGRTLSCALGGANELHAHLCQKLGLDRAAHGPQTTRDGAFTVEFVECLQAADQRPVMMVNDDFYEGVSSQKADEIVGNADESPSRSAG